MVNLLYKKGIQDNWTQDFYLQSSSIYTVVSTLSHFVPSPKFGMINAGLSINSNSQNYVQLGWERTTSKFSFSADYKKSFSQQFCLGYNQPCINKQIQLSASSPLPNKMGNLSLNLIKKEIENNRVSLTSLQWSKQINKNINLFTNLSKSQSFSIQGSQKNTSIYFGVSINLDKNISSNTSLFSNTAQGLNLQQSFFKGENPEHPEYGYGSLSVNKSKEDQTINLYYGAKLNKFDYQLTAYKDKKGISSSLNLNGALVYIPEDNYLGLSRSIPNAIAYVKVENLTEPVAIYHENRLAGMTDNKGRIIVSDGTNLNTENVHVDINKMPANLTLEEYRKEYYIPFSGAVRVDFKAKSIPYTIKINGAEEGAIFSIGKDYYVVGEKGIAAVEKEGLAEIPLSNNKVCKLDIKKTQKEYSCTN